MSKRANEIETENVDQNKSARTHSETDKKPLEGVTIAVVKPLILGEQGDQAWLVEHTKFKAHADLPAHACPEKLSARARACLS